MNPPVADDVQLLAAIVDSASDGIVSIDLSGHITSWNRGAELLFGYSRAEALGAPVAMLSPSASGAVVAGNERAASSEQLRVRKNRSRVMVAETRSPVRDESGRVVGMVLISHDITDHYQLAEELRVTRREVELRNRRLERSNTELEQFAYVASHDLSEPLRAVAGMVGLLGRRYRGRLDEDADEFIAFAVDGCERMRAMIDDLLAYSRAGRVELDLNDVSTEAVVRTVLSGLGPQLDEIGAVVQVRSLPSVRADGGQIAQVFQNLISNAIKFRRPDVPPVVEVIGSHDPAGFATFEVVDNGIGIEEQYRARIFRMFQRLHPADAYPGTGIGLAIAQRIVERHGGQIGVKSNRAAGSSFWFTLPDDPDGHRL